MNVVIVNIIVIFICSFSGFLRAKRRFVNPQLIAEACSPSTFCSLTNKEGFFVLQFFYPATVTPKGSADHHMS